jgi:hypothetical protein
MLSASLVLTKVCRALFMINVQALTMYSTEWLFHLVTDTDTELLKEATILCSRETTGPNEPSQEHRQGE